MEKKKLNNSEKIAKLKQELEKYSKRDDKINKKLKEKQEIALLKKKIRDKKYAGLKRTGRNLKVIGKNIGIIGANVGKTFGKIIEEKPKPTGKESGSVKKLPKQKTIDEIIASLPQ